MTISRVIGALLSCLALPTALALGLPDITYPVFLPYNQGDQKMELRSLPFATRHSSPEFIGSALSAQYVVPSNDSANLPKDINVISACGLKIATSIAKNEQAEKRKGVAIQVDLRGYKKPQYLPFSDSEIMGAVARAVIKTLAKYGYQIREISTVASAEGEHLAKLLEQRLQSKKENKTQQGKPR